MNSTAKKDEVKFAGIEVPPELTRSNFFFLFFNTFLIGMLMSVLSILQPPFLKDIININQDFAGSINALLMNLNEIATLALVALVGVISDRIGRKRLAIAGFAVLAVFYYLLSFANGIGSLLNVPAEAASRICALLSFVPSRSAEFVNFAPGLLATYIIRLFIGIGLVLCYPQFITMVADYTYEKDRGKGMALNGVMMGLASMLIFALFAPLLARSGVLTVLYIISFIGLGAVVCTGMFLKDRLPEVSEGRVGLVKIIPIVRQSLPLKVSYWCTLVSRADIVVLATFVMTWGVKYGKQIGLAAQEATFRASIPMMVLSVAALVCFPVAGILVDKWGRVPTIILALLSSALAMLLLAVSPTPFSPLVIAGMLCASLGMAGAMTGANTLASDASPRGMVGSILGGLNTMQPLGILFFVGLGGYLFDTLGPGFAFALKGMSSLVLGLWMFVIRGKIKLAGF